MGGDGAPEYDEFGLPIRSSKKGGKKVRKLAGRVQQKSTSSQDEPQSRKGEKGKKKKKEAIQWKYVFLLLLMFGGGIQVIIPMMDNMFKLFSIGWTKFSVTETKELRHALTSGEPWVILCAKQQSGIPKVWERAAFLQTKWNKPFNMGVVDCYSPLPSGMTILERLKLKTASVTASFIVANGNKAKMVPAHMYIAGATSEDTDKRAKSLFNYVAKQVALKPQRVTSTKELEKFCLKKSSCILFMDATGQLTNKTKEVMNEFGNAHRLTRMAYINSGKYLLSLEKGGKLPEYKDAADSPPRVVYFQRNSTKQEEGETKTLSAVAFRSPFSAENLATFMSKIAGENADGVPSSLKVLRKNPKVTKRFKKETKKKKKKKADRPKKKKSTTKKPKKPKNTAEKTKQSKSKTKTERKENVVREEQGEAADEEDEDEIDFDEEDYDYEEQDDDEDEEGGNHEDEVELEDE